MRSFPYLIIHCIEYARSKFNDIFVNSSNFLKEFNENHQKAEEKLKK